MKAIRTSVFLLLGAPLLALAQLDSTEPPRDTPLVEKSWDALADHEISEVGIKALAINPTKWRHAETPHFILHFRRVTEARKVAREVEFDLWFVAKTLNAGPERYAKKSDVYVFQDEAEWKTFLAQSGAPPWAGSFAIGDDLFLNVRGFGGQFDSSTLAHETTHAVVARLYPRQRWPLWLNEGFAEYMAGASVAARENQPVRSHQTFLEGAGMPFDEMLAMQRYPSDEATVSQLYQSAEKLVRFLFNKLPPERFPKFAEAMMNGETLDAALTSIYGDKVKDFATFQRQYARFIK
jgi:hypothetical protein